MTVFYGYLDRPYLYDDYMAGFAEEPTGWQAQLVIEATAPRGFQSTATIETTAPYGWQATALIDTGFDFGGWQAQAVIEATSPYAWQAQGVIAATPASGWQSQATVEASSARGLQSTLVITAAAAVGWQTEFVISSTPAYAWQALQTISYELAVGWSVKQDTLAHAIVEYPHGYLDDAYLTVPYLGPWMQAMQGWQAQGVIMATTASAWQAQGIINATTTKGWQAQFVIEKSTPQGWQARSVHAETFGFQATALLYNAIQLRILKDFPSRGLTVASADLNAWGSPIGTGLNWKANTTATSATNSFDVKNVNTDLVEQRWQGQTATVTGVTLDCDTEKEQGVFLDTFAMLETNITSSATISLIGSNTSDFSVIGTTIALQSEDDGSIVYIAADPPTQGWRYWRISIDDFTQSSRDNYLRVGTIVFGAAVILTQNFVDRVGRDPVNYTDEVFTEAFTNAQNDRGIKQLIRLDFRNLKYQVGDYQKLSRIFREARTVLKCLWIPTPQFPKRYMVFGKLRRLPTESHNVKSELTDLVTLTVEVDESK